MDSALQGPRKCLTNVRRIGTRLGAHSGPCDDDRNKSDCREVVLSEPVIARCAPSPVLEPAEHALDHVAAAISTPVERVRAVACGIGRDDRFDAARLEPVAQPVGVVSLVRQQPFGATHPFQQRDRDGDVGNVARCQCEGDRSALIIGQSMDLARSSATRRANRLRPRPPFDV